MEMMTMSRVSLRRTSLNIRMRMGRGQGVKEHNRKLERETNAQFLLDNRSSEEDRVEGGHYPWCNVSSWGTCRLQQKYPHDTQKLTTHDTGNSLHVFP